jgi:hypothetical protein
MLLMRVCSDVVSTLFSGIVSIVACIFIAVMLERRRIPWKFAFVSFLVLLPVFMTRYSHREGEDSLYAQSPFLSVSQKVEQGLLVAVTDFLKFDWSSAATAIEETLSTRLENVSFLGHCVYLHTNGKAFKHGETIRGLVYALVPRFLYPGKPLQDHGDVLSTEYGFKGPGPDCAINFPWLADLYINFGFAGMIVGSLLVGALFRWASSLAAYGIGDMNLLMFCNLFQWFLLVEGNLSMVLSGILQALVVWWVISRYIRPLFRDTLSGGEVLPHTRGTRRHPGQAL